MATVTLSLPSLMNYPTQFASSMSAIAATFATVGLVQTADTGQINFAALPGGFVAPYNDNYGYQIWRFADTLQGTAPWFIKVWYGTINAGGGNPGAWFAFQVGTATDGAGNFTGAQVSQRFIIYVGSYNVSNQSCFIAGSTNRFTWALFDGPTQFESLNVGIERTKDASGADTGDGVLIFGRSNAGGSVGQGSSQVFSQCIPSTGTVLDAQTMWPAAINLKQSTMATGISLGWAYPIPYNGAPFNYGKNFLVYQSSDFPVYTVQSLTVYGASHNYLVCSPNAFPPTQPPALSHVMCLFE